MDPSLSTSSRVRAPVGSGTRRAKVSCWPEMPGCVNADRSSEESPSTPASSRAPVRPHARNSSSSSSSYTLSRSSGMRARGRAAADAKSETSVASAIARAARVHRTPTIAPRRRWSDIARGRAACALARGGALPVGSATFHDRANDSRVLTRHRIEFARRSRRAALFGLWIAALLRDRDSRHVGGGVAPHLSARRARADSVDALLRARLASPRRALARARFDARPRARSAPPHRSRVPRKVPCRSRTSRPRSRRSRPRSPSSPFGTACSFPRPP